MSKFLFKLLTEHHNYPKGEPISPEIDISALHKTILFQKNPEKKCIEIREDKTLHSWYYVGVDWISQDKVVYVAPKLNTNIDHPNRTTDNESQKETDFVKMLFHCLKYQEITSELDELVEVKWGHPKIAIDQKRDILTPFLIVQFLSLLKIIVRKGLKKSYYETTQNLNSRVKGRVLVSRTLKENTFKSKKLNTFCSYDEFGLNGFENRLLKRTLSFIKKYLPIYKTLNSDIYIQNLFSYINPAFVSVSEDINLNEIRYAKINPFYKEYEQAIKLAKMILKRYAYNITNVERQIVDTPPFWIDMSKLFELYVLGLLKDQFKNQIIYHPTYNRKELDYLLLNPPMVIDAKYKPRYSSTSILEDIRQLSGYSRLLKVYETLKIEKGKIIDCLIIYPDLESNNKDLVRFEDLIREPGASINGYINFFKIGIELPLIR